MHCVYTYIYISTHLFLLYLFLLCTYCSFFVGRPWFDEPPLVRAHSELWILQLVWIGLVTVGSSMALYHVSGPRS